jgi:nucleoside-diphosphate-sugar epimerase
MVVVVTGITGFVGSHLGRRLVQEGHEVHAVARPGSSTRRIEDYRDRVRWIEADLADGPRYAARLREIRPERAFHTAWYAEHGRFWTAPENFDCVGATLTFARALADAGCPRLVAVGSCAEYAWGGDAPLREDASPCEPGSLYGVAKHATRQLLEALGERLGVAVAWARLFFPYGPGEAPTRLIPSVALALLRGEPARCSHGRQERDFVHVEDCASALCAIAASPLRGPVNVGTGAPTPIAAVVETLARLCGRPREAVQLGAIAAPPGDPPRIVADAARLTATGWRPAFALETGLAQTVEWWRKTL